MIIYQVFFQLYVVQMLLKKVQKEMKLGQLVLGTFIIISFSIPIVYYFVLLLEVSTDLNKN